MNRVKITDNFYLDEFIDPATYAARGTSSIELLDMRIVMGIQYLREQSGRVITINNWATGGQYKESGLRRFDTKTGAKWSQHKYGRAIDTKWQGWTIKQAFDFVVSHQNYLIDRQLITTIENISATPTWLHLDCRYTGMDKFKIVNP